MNEEIGKTLILVLGILLGGLLTFATFNIYLDVTKMDQDHLDKEGNLQQEIIQLEQCAELYSESLNKITELEKAPDCKCSSQSYCYEPETTFSSILKNNANLRDYILDEYDCTEFSEGLSETLNHIGFRTRTKVVKINCDLWTDDWDALEAQSGYSYKECKKNNLHQIVNNGVTYTEATNGEIILPEDYPAYGIK